MYISYFGNLKIYLVFSQENITLGELDLVDTFLEQLTVVMASGEGR